MPADDENDDEEGDAVTFESLGLSAPILKAIAEIGYETPTPIQEKTIPPMLAGRDLIGQAQTGTGKTAAFAIPILEKIDLAIPEVQALVLAPTRELAIQVAEAIHSYSKFLGRVGVLPVYGGQPIQLQLKRLDRGVHVVVGTPGRIMDHLRRGSLRLDAVRVVVLDEADEMLRMGFIEDVEWILSQAPAGRQTALFSATLPREVRRIAERHLRNPDRDRDRAQDDDGARHRAALPPRLAAAEARRPGAHPGDRGDGRRADLHPHQERRRRAHRAAPGARLRRRVDARRHEPGAARDRDPPFQGGAGRDRGGHRRRRPRPRRRADQPRRSTTTSPTTSRPTSTASAAPAGPGAPASPCSSSPPASGG